MMKFIFADCLDYIDPNYNFLTDSFADNRKPYWDDMFPHEFMDKAPYDGILVSRAIVGDHLYTGKYTESQAMRFRRDGGRAFLRYSEDKHPGSLLYGDCGAFQYHKLEIPPYTPTDMLDFYEDGMFTHGCSVDHIIFDFEPDYDSGKKTPDGDLLKRQEITLEYAEVFLKHSQPMRKYFQPMGVVQGWSPQSMADAAKKLVTMGYDYIALGGLVPLSVKSIHLALQAVKSAIPANIKTHILGFAKANHLHEFVKYNITSFDTTSPLIRAFKDSKYNYWQLRETGEIEYFMAIKIPQPHGNNKLKMKIQAGQLVQEAVVQQEAKALNAIRAFANREASLEGSLAEILEYTKMILWDESKSEESNLKRLAAQENGYRRTLLNRPWENCNCRVCREVGVEAVIFRSSNRNKRRGIHNLHTFKSYLKTITKC